jgi:hypothetical protein
MCIQIIRLTDSNKYIGEIGLKTNKILLQLEDKRYGIEELQVYKTQERNLKKAVLLSGSTQFPD